MNIDTGVINHWANLFESEEAKKNGTYLFGMALNEDVEQVGEATIKGFTRQDFEDQGVVKHINDEFQRAKLKSWNAEILGSGEDFTIALTDSNSQPPHYDTEYYSADGAYDAWYEGKEYEYQEATKIAFECVDHFLKGASDKLQFVTTFKDGEYDDESRTIYKMVPKASAKKLIDDAIRTLVDQEYDKMRKLPREKREKFFRDHSWPRFALMAANNGQYISNRTDNVSAPYSIDGYGRMFMDMAEKVGAYTWEDFEALVGKDEIETGYDADVKNDRERVRDQNKEFDDATMNIRESSDGKEIIDTFTNILNGGLPRQELKKMLVSLETLMGKKDIINQTELERLIVMYKDKIGGDLGEEEEMVGEVMSIDDIMSSWKKDHADDEKKAAEEKAKKDAEAKARGIKQITITSVGSDGTIRYTIVKNDGSSSEEETKGVGTDDEDFKRTRKMLRSMSGKTPDDLDVFVAMLRRSFDSASKTPIQWYYSFDRGEEGRLDDNWYYRPSEDYLGYTPDFVQSIYDGGGRVGGMI